MTDLSVILVNYNVKDFLRRCLKSIYQETEKVKFEIFVVDNASSDDSISMLKNEFPDVKIIINKENLGFSGANNKAIIKAKGSYLLLLNPDTIILDKAIDRMADFLDKNKEIYALGPMILNKDKTIQYPCARKFPNLWTEFCYFSKLSKIKLKIFSSMNLDYWDHKNSQFVDLLSGSCLMLRRTLIKEIGLMDERFFLYGEDIDLCYRIRQNNKQVYYFAEPKIIHFGGESTKNIIKKRTKIEKESMYWYFKKNKGLLYSFIYNLLALFRLKIFNLKN